MALGGSVGGGWGAGGLVDVGPWGGGWVGSEAAVGSDTSVGMRVGATVGASVTVAVAAGSVGTSVTVAVGVAWITIVAVGGIARIGHTTDGKHGEREQ